MRFINQVRTLLFAFLTALICAVAVPSFAAIPSASPQQIASQADPPNLEQQAKQLFDSGQFREAVPLLQQAAQFYEKHNDLLRQAIALSNLALTYQEQGNSDTANQLVEQSLAILRSPNLSNTSDRVSAIAQVLDIQGRLQLTQGQTEAALNTWQQSAQLYTQLKATDRLIRNQIDQSRALQALGFYPRAKELLDILTQTLQTQPDSLAKAAGLRSLGDALRAIGDFGQSQEKLKESLAIVQQVQQSGNLSPEVQETIALIHLSQGNTARSQQDTDTALSFYQQAIAGSTSTRLQAQLNQLSLLLKNERWSEAQGLLPQIQMQVSQLPLSQTAIYSQINFAQSRLQGKKHWQGKDSQSTMMDVAQVLSTAAQQAESLEDKRAQAYALGKLGELYEEAADDLSKLGKQQESTQQLMFAKDVTRQALYLAKAAANASDITYLWQWHLGRILKTQAAAGILPEQNKAEAIAAYEAALETLQALRRDLVSANQNEQFSFREDVEPAYRELIELLLESAPNDLNQQLATTDEALQDNLVKARETLEALQLAELQDFFRQSCAIDNTVAIDQVVDRVNEQSKSNPHIAIIYPIIQAKKLSVILKLPQQKQFLHYSTDIDQDIVKTKLKTFRSELTQPDKLISFQKTADEVYSWLIRPAEQILHHNQIETIVFVLDGYLKNIPMSALYDDKHNRYLIESYSVAITPGLTLPEPKAIGTERIRLLFAGMTQAIEDEKIQFPALVAVSDEAKQVKMIIPDTEILLDKDFTKLSLQSKVEISPFQIVHLATHGKFSQNQDETFILTSKGRIKVTDLDQVLRTRGQAQPKPIEILVLSACETAEGDDRAALGLAGVAVRAGARSTLASLWPVDDETTAFLIPEFYNQLIHANVSKAEALRQSQLKVLQNPSYAHPNYWAPFILVGNWL